MLGMVVMVTKAREYLNIWKVGSQKVCDIPNSLKHLLGA